MRAHCCTWLTQQQDRTPGKTYDRVIYFLIAVKAFQVLLGPIYDYLDGKLLGHSLRRNEADRLAIRKDKELRGETFPGWQVSRWSLCLFGGQFACMILCSWVVSLICDPLQNDTVSFSW